VDYSIVIPVFNKAALTRNCLRTLANLGIPSERGEVIVVDNASSDRTPEMLAEFPWARVIRNERNRGFAAANNQGATAARGRFLVLLNNDTQPLAGWLDAMLRVASEPGVGIVGARLLYPDGTIQHAGVAVAPVPFGRAALLPYHYAKAATPNDPDVATRREYQIVTAACMVTARDLFFELGGLDETYWNGYEDVDYCLKVRARGLRVVYEPAATLHHFESQSGGQRFRRVLWNIRTLGERWKGRAAIDSAQRQLAKPGPRLPAAVLVHGLHARSDRTAIEAMVRANQSPVTAIRWSESANALGVAREAMTVRGNRFLAFVRADARLEPGWLDELVAQVSSLPNAAAATFAPELPIGANVATLATDARCTLLALAKFPQHHVLDDFDTLDGALADFLIRGVQLERGTRGASRILGDLPPPVDDRSFERRHGMRLREVFDTDPAAQERRLRPAHSKPRGLVSIVTLSWNAPLFTRKALESIRNHTSEPYEVIVVDNGSERETREMLASIDDSHVRIIYNEVNRGFAGGNNDGLAVAYGEHVILLNNDVIVNEGWIEGLLDPFRRIPGLGVTAPRSNRVVGHQQLADAAYADEAAMVRYAAGRRRQFERTGYFVDRAIGLCLCIDRTAIEQIGGLDERFGLGNFEDDDFCLRVRAAGYGIYICNDVFIHHFGSRSFAANNIDYAKTMSENWAKFAAKWGFGSALPEHGYQPSLAYGKGFDRSLHYVPIRRHERSADLVPDAFDCTFLATVHDESDWRNVAEFVARFARAFRLGDGMLLAIGTFDRLSAEQLGKRVERILQRAGVDAAHCADIEISEGENPQAWRSRFAGVRAIDVAALEDRSPSALRRLTARAAV
jgi:GT2 family glycosyltransferase